MPTAGLVGLFDRDVFLKLACLGLWHEAVAAAGVTAPYRLPSCSVSGSAPVLRRWLKDPAVLQAASDRLAAMVAAVPVVDDGLAAAARAAPSFAELANTDDIDAGEAVLVAVLEASEDPAVLLTGDKRFVGALRTHHPARFAALARRILSFERCLALVCQAHGTTLVVERAIPAAACDGSLRLALGVPPGTDHASFLEALASFDPCRG